MDINETRKYAGLPLDEAPKDKASTEKRVVAVVKQMEAREEKAYNNWLEVVAERAIWGNLAVRGGDGTIESEWIDDIPAQKNIENLVADAKQGAKNIGFQDVVGSSFDEMERDLNRKIEKVKARI